MFSRIGRLLLAAFLALGVLAVARPAAAAPPSCVPATAASAADYFNRTVPGKLARDDVPGAVVSVVSGTQTVFTRGYGESDVAGGVPMSADESLVRIASITKLFTATAVMQQVEAGRLDLDADVNTYLKTFRIPRTYPEPVRLRDLLNHTAGFEDRIIGTGARTAEDVVPLGEYLADNVPARIRPPGVVSAYSNYGAALAGYLVTLVSGEPYDRYIQRHILTPLAMAHTTASEPVPRGLKLARSYGDDGDVVPFTFDQLTPDGAISATASDMARFAIAHLNQGRGILSPATTATMHTRSFSADPRLGGYAHGFIDRTVNGHRVLMHDGSWEGFGSALLLVPDCRVAVFFSLNSSAGFEVLGEVVEGFLDRFAPGSAGPSTSGPRAEPPQAGFYAPTRRNASGVEKLLTLLGPARLRVESDGTLRFRNKTWTPSGDGSYRNEDDHLVAVSGSDGVRYVGTDGPTFELLGRTQTLPFNLGVLLVFAVAALSALVVPIVGGYRLARRRAARPGTRRTWRVSRGLAASAALLGLAFLIGLAASLFGDTSAYLYGAPLSFRLLFCLPLVAFALAAGAVGCTVVGWRGAGVLSRVHQVVLLVGIGALTWFCWQWNLIGWQFA
ncbi:serine hydrolase domain-containing protein [Cryptosporangium aurantiacum]|uniref:CubicO group peptidase, beta-lactamase class C family n=1 Tax=Cryptosporangium aurantiacum TaxID=134849 RepID=A0A1M7PSE2_9ACTN|nr:serine hydrolase domain-containing protein [Cryptosporangium aurantiacum]SHN20355.1 CubicO group peptidase, beta-lactamase class C family [Cryptosporangium aurantiacum]